MRMRALSVKQPYANMIANGEKTIEVRTWNPEYRGMVLIVSAKRPPIKPIGVAIAVVELLDVRPFTRNDLAAACLPDWRRAWAWELKLRKRIREPFAIRGKLGLYAVDLPGPL